MEIWKDIKGYEGIYMVSNTGLIKALSITKQRGRSKQLRPEKILKPKIERRGYYCYTLQKDKMKRYTCGHRIVAEAFIPNPENKATVNHIDGDKSNNHVSNLEWATHKEQINHADGIGLRNINGEASKISKLSDAAVLYIREMYVWDSISQTSNAKILAKKYGVGTSTIHRVRKSESWSHVI